MSRRSSTSARSMVSDAASRGGVASLSSTRSPSWASPSSPIGLSSDRGSFEILMASRTFSGVMPISSAISSWVGSRPNAWTRPRDTRTSLLIVSTMCTGTRMVRD